MNMNANTKKTANPWKYATKLIKNLEKSGYFTKTLTNVPMLYDEFVSWSRVNHDVYGTCEIYERQYLSILDGVRKSSINALLTEFIDSDVVTMSVGVNGRMIYHLSTNGVDLFKPSKVVVSIC